MAANLDAAPQVQYRFAHAMPGVGAVDVLLNDTAVLTNSAPFSTTGYLTLDAGAYTLKVVPTGAAAPVYLTKAMNLAADTDNTLVAAGPQGSVQSELLDTLQDGARMAAGTAALRPCLGQHAGSRRGACRTTGHVHQRHFQRQRGLPRSQRRRETLNIYRARHQHAPAVRSCDARTRAAPIPCS